MHIAVLKSLINCKLRFAFRLELEQVAKTHSIEVKSFLYYIQVRLEIMTDRPTDGPTNRPTDVIGKFLYQYLYCYFKES